MAVKTFTVNLSGNLEANAKSAAAATGLLTGELLSLKGATLALSALVIGAGAGLLGLADYAIHAKENINQLSSAFEVLGKEGGMSGDETLAAVRAIAKELPITEARTEDLAQSLMGVGITDLGQVRAQIFAIAGAAEIARGGGEKLEHILLGLDEAAEKGGKFRFSWKQLAGVGLTQKDVLDQLGMNAKTFEAAKKAGSFTGQQLAVALVNAVNEKARGPLENAMHRIGVQFEKGKDTVKHMFESLDINTDKIGKNVSEFFSLFDLAQPSGQFLKQILGGAIQWVSDKFASAIHWATLFFLDVAIYSLYAYNVARFSLFKIGQFLDSNSDSARAWKAVLIGAAVGIGVAILASVIPAAIQGATYLGSLGLAALSAGVDFAIAIWPITLVVAAIAALTAAVIYFWPQIKKAGEAVAEFAVKGWNAAVDFVAGMIKGIVDGTSKLIDAVENMAKGAWKAVKDTLGIHSPSTVMFNVGANVSEGMALGIEHRAGRVEDASAGIASIPASRSTAGAPRSTSSTVTQKNDFHIVINTTSEHQAHDVLEMLEENFAALVERLALSQGAAPAV